MSDQNRPTQELRNQLVTQTSQVPVVRADQKKLDKQLSRFEVIGTVVKAAQDELSAVFVNSQLKVLMAIATAERLKTAYADVLEQTEVEANLTYNTQEFLRIMQEVCGCAGRQIIEEQLRFADSLNSSNFWEHLQRRLLGE